MSSDNRYIAVFDVGTGSGRMVIFDLFGKQIAVSQREWLPKTDPRYPGSQDFDTTEAWQLLGPTAKDAIRKANISPESIVAVTATSMREGIVLYDREKTPIWACTNVDARATNEVVEMLHKDLARPIYEIGGDWLNIITPPRLWWIRDHTPELYERIAHMTMLSDWVLFELSGELVTDPSIGSSSGMFDLKKRTWSEEIIEMAGLPRGIYPPVYESASIIGKVTPAASAATGIPAGTPVITSGGDTQLAMVGSGAVDPMTYTVCGGTFWQCTVLTEKPMLDPQYRPRAGCHVVPGQWLTEAIGFYLGFTMRWFRDGFCQEEKRLAEEQGTDAYTLMEHLAEKIPAGSNGVQAIFSDAMNVKMWKHATPSLVGFDILNPDKTGKSACIRAIEESSAYVVRKQVDILKEVTGVTPDEMIFTGGSSKGFLWPQIISDVMGVPLRIPEVKESASLGAEMCALIALGEVSGWGEAVSRLVRWERHIDPDPVNHACYDDTYHRWLKVYPYIMQMADDGVMPSLWRAPGI